MHNADVETIYPLVVLGTPVDIQGYYGGYRYRKNPRERYLWKATFRLAESGDAIEEGPVTTK